MVPPDPASALPLGPAPALPGAAAAGRDPRRLGGTATAVTLVALVAAVAAYAPALRSELQYDDATSIRNNLAIREVGRVLSGFAWGHLLGPERPVTELSFALDYARGGLDPFHFHATSLALHVVAAVLVLLFARGMLRSAGVVRADGIAAVCAAAFALHPLQTEAVALAAQRSEVLSGVLALAALALLVAADRRLPRPGGFAAAGLATVTFALALGAKSTAVAVPAAFVLRQVALGVPAAAASRWGRLGRAVAVSSPLWLLAAASVVRNLSTLGPEQTAGLHAGDLGPLRYLCSQLRVHWLYARLTFWPSGQSLDHAFAPSPGLSHAPTLVALAATIGVLSTAAWLWARSERGQAPGSGRVVALGVAWFLVWLAPSSSFVPIADLVAEHRVYLASFGLVLAAAVAIDHLLERFPPRSARLARAATATCVLVGLALALASRVSVWRTPVALWSDTARKNPASGRVFANLGMAQHAAGNRAEAEAAYRTALRLSGKPIVAIGAARNLSALLLEGSRPAEALEVVEEALRRAPLEPVLHHNRAAALVRLGRLAEARAESQRAIGLDPTKPAYRNLLGIILDAEGRSDAAVDEFRSARTMDPAAVAYAEHEFLALARARRYDEACQLWETLVRDGRAERTSSRARSRAEALACR